MPLPVLIIIFKIIADLTDEYFSSYKDEMVRWYHQLNGHEFEQAPGDGEGQGSVVCCSPWARKESDMTEQLNNNNHHLSQLK